MTARLQEAKEKWDIADPIPDGVTAEAIVKSILNAPEIAAPSLLKTLAEFLAGFQTERGLAQYFVNQLQYLRRGVHVAAR